MLLYISKIPKMASDFVVIENATWCPDINLVMERFRQDGKFCNVTLRSCDGQEFHAHDLVLAASSADLQALLLTQMQKDCILQIETVQGKTIEYMLQFIYSGQVCLPVGELHALTAVAEQLSIEQLKSLCSRITKELQSQEVEDLVDGMTEDLVPYSYSETGDMSSALCGDVTGTDGESVVTEEVVELPKEAEEQNVSMSAQTVEISQGNTLLTTVKMDTEALQQQQVSLVETTTLVPSDEQTLTQTFDRDVSQVTSQALTQTAGQLLIETAYQILTQTADRMLSRPSDGEFTQTVDGKLVHTGGREITQTGDIVLTQTGDILLTQTGDSELTQTVDSELTQTGDSAPTQICDGEQALTGVQVKVESQQHDQGE